MMQEEGTTNTQAQENDGLGKNHPMGGTFRRCIIWDQMVYFQSELKMLLAQRANR